MDGQQNEGPRIESRQIDGEGERASFQTTCWTEVLEAARRHDPAASASESMEMLCQRYWYPLYAFLRRRGHDATTAEDYVQGFFADLLRRDSLRLADPGRGRFRTFLLTACKNYVSNEQRRDRTARRGGDRLRLSLEFGDGERRYRCEPADPWTAERLFDRRWAMETIHAALRRLAERYAHNRRSDRFEALRPLIAPAEEPPSHAEIAEQLGITEGAVKVAAHRLRQQFAAALRDEVAATLDFNSGDPVDVDAELAELLAALRG